MAKLYKVKVNGKLYEVEVESVTETQKPIEAPKAAPAAPAPAPAEGTKVVAPMQGTILKVLVAAGAAVKRGSPIAILEAMKLENEIQSPRDGIVKSIHVQKGESVDADRLIAVVG